MDEKFSAAATGKMVKAITIGCGGVRNGKHYRFIRGRRMFFMLRYWRIVDGLANLFSRKNKLVYPSRPRMTHTVPIIFCDQDEKKESLQHQKL